MDLRNFRRAEIGFIAACMFGIISLVIAAEDAPKTETPKADAPQAAVGDVDPAAAFTAAQANWDQLEKDVRAVVDEFRNAADNEARTKLRTRYEALVKQGNTQLGELRTAAHNAFLSAPNKNELVVTVLIRMLADDVRRDDYEAAMKLAQSLIEHKCENDSLYNFAGIAAYCVDDFTNAEAWLSRAEKAGKLGEEGLVCKGDVDVAKTRFAHEQELRKKEVAANDLPRVQLETSQGMVTIELFENEAPESVANFISLVDAGYYNGLTFHRVLANFMAQGGCPDGSGTGGPGYKIHCECEKPEHREHFRGTLSMAHAGKNTGGSQFFLTFRRTPHLDGRHTVFGRVIDGWEVLAKLQRRNPGAANAPTPDKIVKAAVLRKRDHEYKPHKVE